MQDSGAQQHLVRDKLTWLCYLVPAISAFVQSSLGPIMPFMRAEYAFSMTVAAYHFSAWSVGSFLAGSVGDKILQSLGRARVVWIGATLLSLCYLGLGYVPNHYCTIGGILLSGFCSSLMSIAVVGILSERSGEDRAVAFTEMNLLASTLICFTPGAVALCMAYATGWRALLFLPLLTYLSLFLAFRNLIGGAHQTPAATRQEAQASTAPLPMAYWAYWSVIALNCACEWSLYYWSPEFFERVAGCERSYAGVMGTAFLAAMVTGRLVGCRLADRLSAKTLLPYAAFVALGGFAFFWLCPLRPFGSVIGLFVCGLGMANFYPLTLAAAVATAPEQTTKALARMSIASAVAIIAAPLALGSIADAHGVFFAFGIIMVLLLACTAMVFVANHQARLHAQTVGTATLN